MFKGRYIYRLSWDSDRLTCGRQVLGLQQIYNVYEEGTSEFQRNLLDDLGQDYDIRMFCL